MDPRTFKVGQQADLRSDLMKAKGLSQDPGKVAFCPFGCNGRQMDDNGYCRHLVGFTFDSPEKAKKGLATMEPMVRGYRGSRIVQVPMKVDPDAGGGVDFQGRSLMVPDLPAVLKTDVLVQITTSYRVYRDVDATEKPKSKTA